MIVNGTFDYSLEGWAVNAAGRGFVVRDRYGRAILGMAGCESYASLSQDFVIDAHVLSFDWGTFSWGSAHLAEWQLVVEGAVVAHERFPFGWTGSWNYGRREMDLSEHIGKNARIVFQIRPNYGICGEVQYTILQVDNVLLAPKTGSISFSTAPEGARIILDGSDTGAITPAVIGKVPIGVHAYALRLENYKEYTGTVEVFENQVSYVSAVLEPLTGDLNINSLPPGADIYIDGAFQNVRTPALIRGIIVGRHEYRLKRHGIPEATGMFDISPNQTTYVNVLLATGEKVRAPIEIPIPEIHIPR